MREMYLQIYLSFTSLFLYTYESMIPKWARTPKSWFKIQEKHDTWQICTKHQNQDPKHKKNTILNKFLRILSFERRMLSLSGNHIPFHQRYDAKTHTHMEKSFAIFFSIRIFYAPNVLGLLDNYITANAMPTPPHIVGPKKKIV